jgi:O-antigen/teichoic acid export membrane protein
VSGKRAEKLGMSSFKNLLNSAAAYTVANILNSAIPFFLLPVLTRVLTPAEYGTVTMFTTIMSVLSAFTGLSIQGAVSVRYFDKQTDHPRFVGTALAVMAGSTLMVLLVVWLIADPLMQWTQVAEGWLLMAVLASASQFIIHVRLVIWQVKNEVMHYGIFQIAQTLFNLSLSLGLILMLGMGWEGRILGIVAAVFLFGNLSLYSLHRKGLVSWQWDRAYAKAVLRFGLPLIPHTIGGMMMAMSDKFIITSQLGVGVTGAYAVGAQLGMVVGLFADAFVKAYGPYLYQGLRDGGRTDGVQLAQQCLMIFLGFLFFALIYAGLLPYVHHWIVGVAYVESLRVAQLIGLGNAFLGMYYTVAGYLFFFEKTTQLAGLTFVVGLVNLVTTYVLVSYWGLIGAAWGYLIVQAILFLGAWCLAQNVYPLPWRTVLIGNIEKK